MQKLAQCKLFLEGTLEKGVL